MPQVQKNRIQLELYRKALQLNDAKAVGRYQQQIGEICEWGRNKTTWILNNNAQPTAEELVKIGQLLEVPAEWLMESHINVPV